MAGTNTTLLEAVTKEVYEKDLEEQLNHDVITLRRIERTSEGVSNRIGGRYTTFPIHTRRNKGIGARYEGQALPKAGFQGTAAAELKLKFLYGTVELTGQALSLIDKDYQAFISALDLEMTGIKRDLAKDLNRQVYGDGRGGIGSVTTAATSNTLEVDNIRSFELGAEVDVIAGTDGTVKQAARIVNSIDEDNSTVTLSGSNFAHVVGDLVVRHGSGFTAAGGNKEWTGLGAIVGSSNSLYGIDPADEPVWQSVIEDNGGTSRPVSENLLTRTIHRVKRNGGNITVGFTDDAVQRAYANLLMQQRSFVNTKEFTGGFSGIGFVTDGGEIPIVVDFDAPANQITFLNEKDIKVYREKDWSFLDRDGSKWKIKTDADGTYDAWYAILHQYSELGTGRRNTHARVEDLIGN